MFLSAMWTYIEVCLCYERNICWVIEYIVFLTEYAHSVKLLRLVVLRYKVILAVSARVTSMFPGQSYVCFKEHEAVYKTTRLWIKRIHNKKRFKQKKHQGPLLLTWINLNKEQG